MKRHGVLVKPTGNVGAAFNPAAIKHDDGRYIMLVRTVDKGYEHTGGNGSPVGEDYKSYLSLWEGDAPDNLKETNHRAIVPEDGFDKYGVEDPRITKINDTYYVFYTSIAKVLGRPDSVDGIRIAMASTKDFKTFKKHGVIGPDRCSKAGAVFKSDDNLYFMWKDEKSCERTMMSPAPKDFENPEAWQQMWGGRNIEKDVLIEPQKGKYEDLGIEPGAPPLEVAEGFLTVYSSISSDKKWTISAMLLDKKDPCKILKKTEKPLLSPEKNYELKGDVNQVVFPCGAIIDNERLYIYYGGADRVCAVASENMADVRESLKPFKDNPVSKERSLEPVLQIRQVAAKEKIKQLRKQTGQKKLGAIKVCPVTKEH